MDYLQNLLARHQTETTQPQAARSGVLVPSGLIVQPRQKLRFEEGSESLMQAADVHQDGFSELHLPKNDSEYLRPQMFAAFKEFDIGPATHREQSGEKLNARAADSSSERLFCTLTVPHNEKQAHQIGNAADQKSSAAHLALGAVRKMTEGEDRVTRETHVVQPVSQFDSQSHKPQDGQLDVGNRFSEMTQHSAQSLSQQGVHQSTYKSAYQNKQHSAQNAGGADPASSPASLSNSGSLQAPDWLNQIQADLQDRWQALNRKPQAEPVINVTIGRVEVRAVQADSSSARKKRTLPSGVMTLESYLKQRDHKGGV